MNIGDVLLLKKSSKFDFNNISYQIHQIPNVNGGIVAIDAFTGKVLALVGGYDFNKSKFCKLVVVCQPGRFIVLIGIPEQHQALLQHCTKRAAKHKT